jgi:HEAT repeat protein
VDPCPELEILLRDNSELVRKVAAEGLFLRDCQNAGTLLRQAIKNENEPFTKLSIEETLKNLEKKQD